MDTLVDASVGAAMHTFPKTCGPATTVADAHTFFGNPKVHALLVVDDGVLLSVVERADLDDADPDAPAAPSGTLAGRVVAPSADLRTAWDTMTATGRRRLAVVEAGRLVGLLCLKRTRRGFCSDEGIRARIDERAAVGGDPDHR